MGYRHREDPVLVDMLVKQGKAFMPTVLDDAIEVDDLPYTVGSLAEPIARLAGKNFSVISSSLSNRHHTFRDQGKRYCYQERLVLRGEEYFINIVDGLYVCEFLPVNIRRFVIHPGESQPSIYERWKTNAKPKDPHLPEQYLH